MTSQKIIVDDAAEELALEIQRELEQDREDQFILEQMMMIELDYDQHNKQQHFSGGDKKA
jgi:hypothetical protein